MIQTHTLALNISRIVSALLLVLTVPILGLSKNDSRPPVGQGFICGTSAERELNALAKGQYYESLSRRFRTRAPEVRTFAADMADVAVMEDDGSILSEANSFNLQGKAFRFEPLSSTEYGVVATGTAFDAGGGTSVQLRDDDTRIVDLGFSFTYYGIAYTSVQLNSDGNLTFTRGDTATTERDLNRFVSGPPRIGPYFTDLDPPSGEVKHRVDADGTIFIWDKVPNLNTANFNSFSVKLFKNGNIELVYDPSTAGKPGENPALIAVCGISPGSNEGSINGVHFSKDLPITKLGGSIVEVFSTESELSETALTKMFYRSHPDEFDHITVFLAFDHDLGGGFAFEINVRNEIQGIGLTRADNSQFWGSNGRLRSFLMMGTLTGPSRYPDDPNQIFLGTNSTVHIMGQESGHRWLAFTPFQDGSASSRAILGRQNAHWSFFFDSDASVMEGNDIEDRGADKGNERFSTVAATNTYSKLDQYVIGLIGKEEVPDMFFVESPSGTLRTPSSSPSVGVTFGGNRKEVTIDSIIAANGQRVPSVFQAPKVFRQAFVLLTRKGQTATADQIAKVQRIRDAWVKYFNEQTGKRGWVITSLQNTAGTKPSKIYFPYFQGNTQRYTGIAVANWGTEPADVLFTTFDNAGNATTNPSSIINPRMITIPPGEQTAMLGEQIHGLSLSDARNGWIQAESTSSQLSGFFLDGDVDLSLLDGAVAGSTTATEIYFTRTQLGTGLVASKTYKNLIDIINPNSSPAAIELKFIDERGSTSGTAARTIVARGRLAEDLSTLFPSLSQPNNKGYVKVTSDVGIIGYQLIDGGTTIYALPAQTSSTVTKLYSAQFASGGVGGFQYFTDLNFINTASQMRSLQIQLIGNDGTPVGSPVNRTLLAGEQLRSRGEALFGFPDAASSTVLREGSLLVTVDGPGVIGDVLFGDPVNEKFLASLPLDGNPTSNLVFSQVAQGSTGGGKSYFTGIAMYNPNTTDISVTVDVHSDKGAKTGTTTFVLGKGSRMAKTLPQLVSTITNQLRGYLRVTSTLPLVAFELFGDQLLEFLAAVPPQIVSSAP